MYIGKLYDQQIQSNSWKGLLQKASKIANGKRKPIDEMIITLQNNTSTVHRINTLIPNNTFIPGKWN